MFLCNVSQKFTLWRPHIDTLKVILNNIIMQKYVQQLLVTNCNWQPCHWHTLYRNSPPVTMFYMGKPNFHILHKNYMHKKWRALLKKSYQEIEFLGLFWELLLQVQQIFWFCVFILDFFITMFNLCFPFLGNSKPTISLYKKTNILRILECFLLNTIKDYVKNKC